MTNNQPNIDKLISKVKSLKGIHLKNKFKKIYK